MVSRFSAVSHPIRLMGIIILLAVVTVFVLEITNTTYLFHARKAKSGTIPTLPAATSKAPKKSTSNSTNNPAPASPKSNSTGAAPPANSGTQPPATPFGSFVSNHRPNLSGSPAPSTEQSVCNTTPGATCYIEFTQNGVVKKLASQTADSNGLASWSWDVNQAGFTEGTWQIKAIATLNGQTATASDSLSMVVGP